MAVHIEHSMFVIVFYYVLHMQASEKNYQLTSMNIRSNLLLFYLLSSNASIQFRIWKCQSFSSVSKWNSIFLNRELIFYEINYSIRNNTTIPSAFRSLFAAFWWKINLNARRLIDTIFNCHSFRYTPTQVVPSTCIFQQIDIDVEIISTVPCVRRM